jgi:hypothetical protein
MASFALNPSLFQGDTFPDVAGAFVCSAIMEGPFKFLFGSKGRINRAQYWHPHVIFSLARLFAVVAPGVLRGDDSTRPPCESSMLCGRNGHVAALRPGVGFCARDVEICRNRLAARYRGA